MSDLEGPTPSADKIAALIASVGLRVEDLTAEGREHLAKEVAWDRLKRDLDGRVDVAGVDVDFELAEFLATFDKSPATRRVYAGVLRGKFLTWCGERGLRPAALTPGQADDFIGGLRSGALAARTVNMIVGAVSSFYSWLERRYSWLKNPFRGTRARPRLHSDKPLSVPSADELAELLVSLPAVEAAAVAVMAFRGLRVGALPGLVLKGSAFKSKSKGREISGELSAEAMEWIARLGLDMKKPFADWTAAQLTSKVYYALGKAADSGQVEGRYSAHDFRHFFAVREYQKDHDLYRLKELLGHTSIMVTETYLKGLLKSLGL